MQKKVWNLALAGCGVVGRGFLELLEKKGETLARERGLTFRVVLVSTGHHGHALNPDGLDLQGLLQKVRARDTLGPSMGRPYGDLLAGSGADILVEVTPTNLETGEPGVSHIKSALSQGIHVATTNKGPVALALDELEKLASEKNVRLFHEGVVQGGTPLFALIREGLPGCSIESVQGILNASTNFILTEMGAGDGNSYEEACKAARARGLLEADPTMDVEGWDAAVKLVILARTLFDAKINVNDVEREGITRITPEHLKEAERLGRRVKLLAEVKRAGGTVHASVRPTELPLSHPLSLVDGVENCVTLITDVLGPVSLRGSGGGPETAQGVLADVLKIAGA